MNITLAVPDEIVRRARAAAHEQGTSLNTLVRTYLESLAGQADGDELADRFDALWNERAGHSGGGRLDRDDLYDERVGVRR